MIKNLLSDIKFTERESALLKHNNKEEKEMLPFVTQYQPSVSSYLDVVRIDQNVWWMFTLATTNICGLISRKDAGFFSLLSKGR